MRIIKFLAISIVFVFCGFLLSSFFSSSKLSAKRLKFPYRHAGLTERQAAAHLLNRFTFGAKPGQIDSVIDMGLEKWFAHQLNADLPEDSLNKRLCLYDDLKLSNAQATDKFPVRGSLYSMAVRDGYVSKDSLYIANDKKAFNAQISAYMKLKGFKPEQELYNQFFDQKILRAAYANNQLQEVLTDFWFNHFNVSYAKNGPGRYIPAYERDAIRSHVTGKFDELLLATAKSPAMLLYLDNNSSVAPPITIAPKVEEVKPKPITQRLVMGIITDSAKMMTRPRGVRKNVSGLNENYAREVMELHTLGVDGGYTQQDVTQAAGVLTGWTVFPMGDLNLNNGLRRQFINLGEEKMASQGYYHDGDFLFIPNRHDKREKTILGHHFEGTAGYQEGVDLLEMLAHHPSTAKFITRKLAVRFVCDNPPAGLLNKMSKSFIDNDGDIKQVLMTMVNSPEFWSAQALRQKTKSPFELAISTVRALNADITQPRQLYNWVAKMGQRLYYYLAPTGFPDRATYWINTGSLLSRMNFGLELASQRIPGVRFNLLALNHFHEPESPADALSTYNRLLLPERNTDKALLQESALLNDPDLFARVNAAVNHPIVNHLTGPVNKPDEMMNGNDAVKKAPVLSAANQKNSNSSMLGQVVGIIIGSPEYQRR